MSKIYVITNGYYSDYHIITATTVKGFAEKVANMFNAEIEEFDDSIVRSKLGCKIFMINADKSLNITEINEYEFGEYDLDIETNMRWNAYLKNYCMTIIAETKEKALKIAHDMIAQKKAEIEGL